MNYHEGKNCKALKFIKLSNYIPHKISEHSLTTVICGKSNCTISFSDTMTFEKISGIIIRNIT